MGNCCGAEEKQSEKSALVDKNQLDHTARTFDPEFRGPIENRSCTDVLFCLIFVIAVFGLLVVGVVAFVHGDPRRIILPTDSRGQICGVNVIGNEKLLFFDIISCAKMGPAVFSLGCPTPQVCVKECPSETWFWISAEVKDRLERTLKGPNAPTEARKGMVCLDGKNGNADSFIGKSISALVHDNECAPYTYASISLMGRCMPKIITDVFGNAFVTNMSLADAQNVTIDNQKFGQASKYLSQFMQLYGVAQSIFDDLVKSWHFILLGCILATLLALVWIFLLRLMAQIMVIISLIAFLAIFAFSSAFSFLKWNALKQLVNKPELKFTPNFTYYFQLEETWLIMGIATAVVLALSLIVLIFLFDRIRIAVELIREASKCISHMMLTLLWPIVPVIMQMVVLAFFLIVAIHLQSIGKPEGRVVANYSAVQDLNYSGLLNDSTMELKTQILAAFPKCDPESNNTGKLCQFLRYGSPQYIWAFQLFNVFMFLWLFNFVVALGQITLAGAFASYYWTLVKPDGIPSMPIFFSFCRSIRYHLGSLAFGSLIIAIVQMVRIMLEYVDNKVKCSENPIAKFIIKCMKCCFWCLEKFLKFINKNAYIMIAIYGENFCTSAKNAFFLILRNVVRVFVVDHVTDFLLLIGKLVVVGLVGTLAFFFFDGTLASKNDVVAKYTASATDLKYYFIPVFIIIIAAYFIASVFFHVYNMAVDTLLLCFLEDLERNDGSPEKPYFMSKSLMRILSKKNAGATSSSPIEPNLTKEG